MKIQTAMHFERVIEVVLFFKNLNAKICILFIITMKNSKKFHY
jgi:hypothetical protein